MKVQMPARCSENWPQHSPDAIGRVCTFNSKKKVMKNASLNAVSFILMHSIIVQMPTT